LNCCSTAKPRDSRLDAIHAAFEYEDENEFEDETSSRNSSIYQGSSAKVEGKNDHSFCVLCVPLRLFVSVLVPLEHRTGANRRKRSADFVDYTDSGGCGRADSPHTALVASTFTFWSRLPSMPTLQVLSSVR
jgi:hypothetical protein